MANLCKLYREIIYNGEDRRDIYTIAKRIIIASLPNIRLYAVHEEAKSMMLLAFDRFLKKNRDECGKSQSKANCSKHRHNERCCCIPKSQIVNILQNISEEVIQSPTRKIKTPSTKINVSTSDSSDKQFVSNSPSPVNSDLDKDSAFGSLDSHMDTPTISVNFDRNSNGYISSCASASGYFNSKLRRSATFVITPNLHNTSIDSSTAALNKSAYAQGKCYQTYAKFQPEDNLQWDYSDLMLHPDNHTVFPSTSNKVTSTGKQTKSIRKSRASFPRRSTRLQTKGKYVDVDVNITVSKKVDIKTNRKLIAKQSDKCCNSSKLLKQLKSIVCNGFERCSYEYNTIHTELSNVQCENLDIRATLSDAKLNSSFDEAILSCLTIKFDLLNIRNRLNLLENMVTSHNKI